MDNKKIIYIGVFLDAPSRARLLEAVPPKYPVVHADHVTLVFRPTPAQIRLYANGQYVLGAIERFHAIGVSWDQDCQAVRVVGIAAENDHAHITISCADGVKPAYSNELLSAYSVLTHWLPRRGIELTGVVDTLPRSATSTTPAEEAVKLT